MEGNALRPWRLGEKLIPQEDNIARMMSFPLAKAQRTQRFLRNDPLSDLGGWARKIPASSYYSLAKARRTLKFLWNNSFATLAAWRENYIARKRILACCLSSRKGAKNAKAAQGDIGP